ncbi:hypothetical protein GGTG_13529 [Gaeumannomyces tritici R3-111a-1]|uniref:Fungal N-terminal domain-containing protein n=1 Tax=Gaeumannomyces tritici (strain R3-111a-1) TaxID=644352 RepID=J3PJ47_GAET3|nr:hypothetical protein GGTG_13529 [Gaeumannomyces tritici R3-111a-1]EJT68941.1 hypothetical protein GGTG_13529 [Gaeumannomyces tritici R3-111a-1]
MCRLPTTFLFAESASLITDFPVQSSSSSSSGSKWEEEQPAAPTSAPTAAPASAPASALFNISRGLARADRCFRCTLRDQPCNLASCKCTAALPVVTHPKQRWLPQPKEEDCRRPIICHTARSVAGSGHLRMPICGSGSSLTNHFLAAFVPMEIHMADGCRTLRKRVRSLSSTRRQPWIRRSGWGASGLTGDRTAVLDQDALLSPQPGLGKEHQVRCYHELVSDGGRPPYSLETLDDVYEHPAEFIEMVRPWMEVLFSSINPDNLGVFSRRQYVRRSSGGGSATNVGSRRKADKILEPAERKYADPEAAQAQARHEMHDKKVEIDLWNLDISGETAQERRGEEQTRATRRVWNKESLNRWTPVSSTTPPLVSPGGSSHRHQGVAGPACLCATPKTAMDRECPQGPACSLASAIAVVELAANVGALCLQYSRDVKKAKDDIDRFRQQTEALKTIAEGAQRLLQSPDGSRFETAQNLRSALANARSQLDPIHTRLEEKLKNGRTHRAMRRMGLRALVWPFESKDVEKIISDLRQERDAISAALQVDQTKLTADINRKIDISKLLVAKGAAFDAQANEHDPNCHPDTRVDLLADIHKWIEDPNAKCIFWLRGMAGTGKSTISRTARATAAAPPCSSPPYSPSSSTRCRSWNHMSKV